MEHLYPPKDNKSANKFNFKQPSFISESLKRPTMSFERRSSADLILQAAEIAEQISGGNIAQYEGHFASHRTHSPLKESIWANYSGNGAQDKKGAPDTDTMHGKCSPPSMTSKTSSQPLTTESKDFKDSNSLALIAAHFSSSKGSFTVLTKPVTDNLAAGSLSILYECVSS